MALLNIEILGAPVLREVADEVTAFDEDLRNLVEDMFQTMYHARGIGLAAPQVGLPRRVLVVDVGEMEEESAGPIALVNPEVVEASKEKERAAEGCLSIPGMEEVVERPARVRIQGYSPSGEPVSLEASGMFGRALQHEIDHLDGVLFIDRVSPLKRKLLLKKWKKKMEEEVSV